MPVVSPDITVATAVAAQIAGTQATAERFASAAPAWFKEASTLAGVKPDILDPTLATAAHTPDRSTEVGLINAQIDRDVDETTLNPKVDASMKDVKEKAVRKSAVLTEYLNKGYDGMADGKDPVDNVTDITAATKQQMLRKEVIDVLKTKPEFQALMLADGEDVVATRLLKDPRFAEQMDRTLTDALRKSQSDLQAANVDGVFTTRYDTESDLMIQQAALQKKQDELKANDDKINDFSQAGKPEFDAITKLSAGEVQRKNDLDAYQLRLDAIGVRERTNNAALAREGRNVRSATSQEHQKIIDDRNAILTNPDYTQKLADQQQLDDLRAEKAACIGKKSTLEQEIRTLTVNEHKAKTALDTADQNVAYARNRQREIMTTYSLALEDAVGKTTRSYTDSRMSERLSVYEANREAAMAEYTKNMTQQEKILVSDLHDNLTKAVESQINLPFDKDREGKLINKRAHKDTRFRSRWETETDESVKRREKYRNKKRPEPAPEMIPNRDQIEDDFNRILKDPDDVLKRMTFDGKDFNSLTDHEKDLLRRNLVRESVAMRQEVLGMELKPYERRLLLKQPWIEQAFIDTIPTMNELQKQLMENGVTAQDITDLRTKDKKDLGNVFRKLKGVFGNKQNMFMMLMMVSSAMLPAMLAGDKK